MNEIKLKCPATIVLSGASFSGKSFFLKRLLTTDMFDKPIDNIFYCYGKWIENR